MKMKKDPADMSTNKDANPDPITKEPGSHPVGTGAGTTAGAAAGAAVGSMAGPVGTAVGAVVGGIAGAAAGHRAGEAVNPTVEDEYWRTNYRNRPYAAKDLSYEEDLAPAYRYGWESYAKNPDRKFDDVESDLGRDWDRARGKSRMEWDKAKLATRDAWHRVERKLPGDADKDGY